MQTVDRKQKAGTETNDTRRTAEFFGELGEEYIEAAGKDYEHIYKRTLTSIEPYLAGNVLNIGSGGVDLPINNNVDLMVSLDVSEKLLQHHKSENKSSVICAESKDLPFRYGAFDVAVAHFALHHFAQKSANVTFWYLFKCIKETSKILGNQGKVIIAENIVSPMTCHLEILAYPFVRFLLMKFNRPPVFLFSLEMLKKCLAFSGFKLLSIMTFKATSKALILPFSIPKIMNPISVAVLMGEKE